MESSAPTVLEKVRAAVEWFEKSFFWVNLELEGI
jgi:hypothetical protein